jgi:hypothetical protein
MIIGISRADFVVVAQKMKIERQIQVITIPNMDTEIVNPSPKAWNVSSELPLRHVLLTVTVEDILIVFYI